MKLFTRKALDSITEVTPLSEVKPSFFSLGSANLDSFLGEGVPYGTLAHLYGPAGVGKTNFCTAAAVACAKTGRKVLFVDTEGGFHAERFRQICKDKAVAERIVIKNLRDFEEQMNFMRNFRKVVTPDFGLVIIDSIVSLYRLEVSGKRDRIVRLSRELGKELAWLSRLARDHNLSVLVCNQVYESFDGKDEMIPVGGSSLMYWAKIIIELQRDSKDNHRLAIMKKHPYMPEGKQVKFKITNKGVE